MLTGRVYRIILLMLFAGLTGGPVRAQLPDYQLHLMPEQEGLKTAGITHMARDGEGFMWLLSQSLVQRFDGRHTLHFPFGETIEKIYVDGNNRKWVLALRSIYLLADAYHGFTEIPFDAPGEPRIIHIYQNGEGESCVARSDGHFRYDASAKKFRPCPPPGYSQEIAYTRYFGSCDSTNFFGRGDSIYAYDAAEKKLFTVRFRGISYLIPLNRHELLVSTGEFKSYHINMQNGEVQPVKPPPSITPAGSTHFMTLSATKLGNNRFLVSSNRGLLEYDRATRQFRAPVFYYNGRPLENQQSCKYMYKDGEGTIYMNHADGVFFMSSRSNPIQYFRNYSDGNETLPDNDVRNFAEDDEGNIWMATTNGIARLSISNGSLKVFEPLGRENMIDFPSYRQLLYDPPYLWIGTSGNGVWLLHTKTGRYSRPLFATDSLGKKTEQLFHTTYVWKILKLADGRFFIAGGGRCFVVDPLTLLTERIHFSTSGLSSRSAIQDSSGRIWHGTNRGLSCVNALFQTYFQARDSFPDRRIAAFCEWKKNRMLVGSKGLFEIIVQDNRMLSFRQSKAIPGNRLVYCMKQDHQGYVWMGTDEGIFRYDPVRDMAVVFDRGDHVQSQAFNSDAAFLSRSGLLFMGGRNGVNYFYPSAVTPPADQLKPFIASFSINSDDSTYHFLAPPFRIPYGDRNIDFTISAPEFKKPFRLQYRYRLEKDQVEWMQTGFNNRVRINNLDPGNYFLQVSASYDGQRWFDSRAPLAFKILSPWWQTGWFRLLCFALLLLLAAVILRYRRRRQEANEMKKTIEYFARSRSEHSSTEEILWDIARNCISRLGFEDCVIYLVDSQRNVLQQKAAYGDKSPRDFEIANPIEIPVGRGISGYVAQTGMAQLIHDTSKDSRYIVDDERRFSELAVPIVHEGKVIGVIDSEHSRKHFFDRRHLKTLETIASLCSAKISTAIAVEKARQAEKELDLLNSRMVESKFQNLRLQMNPHFLFNILTTIQYLIVSQQTNKATNYLNIFSGFLRSILHYAEESVVSLQDELRILTMYIELESLCLDETFTWNVEVDSSIDQEEVQVPFMLLQPFIENAIHHGLIQKPGEKRFSIRIQDHDDEQLTCIIEDNGIGREKAATINGRNLSSVIHKSRGIDIVKQRLALMQQKTSKKAGLEVEDLYAEGRPAGTRVRIVISYYSKEEI